MNLNNDEMMKITAGGFYKGALGIIGGAIVFLLGVLSGFVNPRKCNS